MQKHIIYVLLGLIILLAIATRFYKLGEMPNGFYVDEAGQGYSAYSILKTGKDEFGKRFPIIFRSLTDFKTPVYTYLIVPLIPFFGLNTYTVRLPSAIFGVLAVFLIYLLINELSKDKRLSVISAVILAISPWHILFSRTDFECMISLTFLLVGILFFYKSLKKPYLIIYSAIFIAISLIAYQAERVIVPIIVCILFIRYFKVLVSKSNRLYLFLAIVFAFIIMIPTLSVAFTPGFYARASGLNIFSHIHQMPDGFIASYKGMLSPIINGSWFLTAREFFALYFSYLSPRYMFFLGDYGPRSSFPELSTFFLWQFPFYIYGLWTLFKNKKLGDLKFLLLTLFFVSPIPAAMTRDPYTTIRSLPLVIPQIIIISIGIWELYSILKQKWQKYLSILIYIIVIIYSLFKLYSSVIILNEHYRAKAWDYGWSQVTEEIQNLNTNLPIIIDNARSDVYPQISFFLKYDPSKFQNENLEVSSNEYYTNMNHISEKIIGNIITRPINWEKDLGNDQYLIGDELAISLEQIAIHKLTLIKQINYPDGSPAFRIVKTNVKYYLDEQSLFRSRKQI